MALILPFYVIALYARHALGARAVAVVARGRRQLGICQFLASNYIDYTLTDVLASMGSLAATFILLRFWKPAPDPNFAIKQTPLTGGAAQAVPGWQGGCPGSSFRWSSSFGILKDVFSSDSSYSLAGTANAISITLYNDKR